MIDQGLNKWQKKTWNNISHPATETEADTEPRFAAAPEPGLAGGNSFFSGVFCTLRMGHHSSFGHHLFYTATQKHQQIAVRKYCSQCFDFFHVLSNIFKGWIPIYVQILSEGFRKHLMSWSLLFFWIIIRNWWSAHIRYINIPHNYVDSWNMEFYKKISFVISAS